MSDAQPHSGRVLASRKPNWLMFSPALWMPVIPMLRWFPPLAKRPYVRDRVFALAIASALSHAGYVMYMAEKNKEYIRTPKPDQKE
mmetsp:Transcript_12092/g.27908  ORF Transcript_12092/g.27908 Transcript_12092/m.27908 type:complete len:86 (-) Transcript_12092:176-433(-)